MAGLTKVYRVFWQGRQSRWIPLESPLLGQPDPWEQLRAEGAKLPEEYLALKAAHRTAASCPLHRARLRDLRLRLANHRLAHRLFCEGLLERTVHSATPKEG
jgi:hypothetical protein